MGGSPFYYKDEEGLWKFEVQPALEGAKGRVLAIAEEGDTLASLKDILKIPCEQAIIPDVSDNITLQKGLTLTITQYLEKKLQELLEYSYHKNLNSNIGANCFAFALSYLGLVSTSNIDKITDEPTGDWILDLFDTSCSEHLIKNCTINEVLKTSADNFQKGDVLLFGTRNQPLHMAVVFAIDKDTVWLIQREKVGGPIEIKTLDKAKIGYEKKPLYKVIRNK